MGQLLIIFGSAFGLFSVALGAYFEHGLRGILDQESYNSIQVALRHQQLHSVVILVLGLACRCDLFPRAQLWFGRAGLLMVMGVTIFSGSIYLTHVGGLSELSKLAPTGGVLTMLGWLTIIKCGLLSAKRGTE